MSKLRKSLSKEYWQTLKTILKRKKKATIAIAFAKENPGQLEENNKSSDFSDYIAELFKKTDRCKDI